MQQKQQCAGMRLPSLAGGKAQGGGSVFSPFASPGGMQQRHGSDSRACGASTSLLGSRRRRTEELLFPPENVSLLEKGEWGEEEGKKRGIRRDGVSLYSRTRQQQLINFRRVISDVYEGRLFVSGAAAACDVQVIATNRASANTDADSCLEAAGITHIVNTIGDICPNIFDRLFVYKTYYLKDTRQQDIMCVLSLSGSRRLRMKPTRVLIHCKEGVSRSATLAIAFLMWKLRLPFAEAFEWMRKRRAICSPNTGFTFQLLLLQKRLALKIPRSLVLSRDVADDARDSQDASRGGGSLLPKEGAGGGGHAEGSPRTGVENADLKEPSGEAGAPSREAEGGASRRLSGDAACLSPPSSSAEGGGKTCVVVQRIRREGAERRKPPSLLSASLGGPSKGIGPRVTSLLSELPRQPGGDSGEAVVEGSSNCRSAQQQGASPRDDASFVLLLRLVIHSPHAPDFLLWSEMTDWKPGGGPLPPISEQGAYMLRKGSQGWIWRNSSKCLRSEADVEAAVKAYEANVALVEGRVLRLETVTPGSEPPDFWSTLGFSVPPYPHLASSHVASGLERTLPEDSEEPFHWRDYCTFDPSALGRGEFPSAHGSCAEAVQEPAAFQRQPLQKGILQESLGLYDEAQGPAAESCNASSSVFASAASLQPSLNLSSPPAGTAAEPPRATAAPVVGREDRKAAAKLFCLPNLDEPLDLFDSEDLYSDGIFLLMVEEGDTFEAASGGCRSAADVATESENAGANAWLWVGSEAGFDLQKDLEAVRAYIMQTLQLQPGKQLHLAIEVRRAR
ncbi:hypothetical protein cyc_08641 [Cyclospora cayetanensis]|uniref:Uncharacterized protein n=1 Tax=Cyclospora cayetanensis TaxID=88456 RepID=A0A1D3D2J9_9EIME|nr:hypothetical protein cyc_08641 [Cyclospora cayetanensis]